MDASKINFDRKWPPWLVVVPRAERVISVRHSAGTLAFAILHMAGDSVSAIFATSLPVAEMYSCMRSFLILSWSSVIRRRAREN